MNGHANVGSMPGRGPGAPMNPVKVAGMDKAADFANYFCTYAFLYHQKEMLSDRVRMDAYYNSIFRNARHFQGKTVLDVGTGSGILAIWSAQAGARKVYAVEATNMAAHARTLVSGNGMDHIVEVIEGSIEDINIPEKVGAQFEELSKVKKSRMANNTNGKCLYFELQLERTVETILEVDIIISEWMGYFLVRESMFDSVINARDRWLKPTGMMYPSHARMWVAPMRTSLGEHKVQEYQNSMADWNRFMQETNEQYGVDMNVLSSPYREEQRKYFLQTSLWNSLYPNQIIGAPLVVKEFDCLTATLEEVSSVRSAFRFPLDPGHSKLCGFAGWFDVHFKGCPSDRADHEVELTTAPSVDDTTHWGQQVFLLHPPINIRDGDMLVGNLDIVRNKENHRLMDVKFSHSLERHGGLPAAPIVSSFYIE